MNCPIEGKVRHWRTGVFNSVFISFSNEHHQPQKILAYQSKIPRNLACYLVFGFLRIWNSFGRRIEHHPFGWIQIGLLVRPTRFYLCLCHSDFCLCAINEQTG